MKISKKESDTEIMLKLHYTIWDWLAVFIFIGTPMVGVPLFGAYIIFTNNGPNGAMLFALFVPALFILIVWAYWDLSVVKIHTDTQMVASNKLDEDHPVTEIRNIVLLRDYHVRVSTQGNSTTRNTVGGFTIGESMSSSQAARYYRQILAQHRELTTDIINFHGFELKVPKQSYTDQELQDKNMMENDMRFLNNKVTKSFYPEWQIWLQLTNGEVVTLIKTQQDKAVMMNEYAEQLAESIGCDMIDATGVYPIFIPRGATDISLRKDSIDASKIDLGSLMQLQEPLEVEQTDAGIAIKSTLDKLETTDFVRPVLGIIISIPLLVISFVFFSFPFLLNDGMPFDIWFILLGGLIPAMIAFLPLFVVYLIFRWINNSYKQDVIHFTSDAIFIEYRRLVTRFKSKKLPISSIERIMVYRFSFQFGIEICSDVERLQFSKGLNLHYAKNLEQILLNEVFLT